MKKLNLAFIVSKTRIRKDGKAPVFCRLTYSDKRKQFTTSLFVRPKTWNSSFQELEVIDDDSNYINAQLTLIKNQINQGFLYLQVINSAFTVDDIYNLYVGKPIVKEFKLIEIYDNYLLRIEKLIGKDIQLVTYSKYKESLVHLKSFVKWKFKKSDIQISELKYSFIVDYEYFLKAEKNLQVSTLNKVIQRFRKVVSYAISQNHIDKDPFYGYKAKRVKKEIIFLDKEQLRCLEDKNFDILRLQQIKDMFVFCCYTGLGFKEMINLEYSDIIVRFDSNEWLKIERNKTNKNYYVPLLPQAKVIIDKYQNNSKFVLPQISNPKFNAYLKEIATIVGIEFNLTHHIARKTFATTVLLINDISMEVVSELLGHSKLSTTQEHYAKVVQSKVSEQMNILSKKLNFNNAENHKN
ncbi:site-specific integrase [Flavobacterium psychraquaticum]|uniref:site-specific integrase n=1 Tax=Flavobacterium psychraquaticum TaxID=3103958 RepID=UPI002ACE8A50|nr:site-specific integrase [Flavobacterium sp. LB-N7T]